MCGRAVGGFHCGVSVSVYSVSVYSGMCDCLLMDDRTHMDLWWATVLWFLLLPPFFFFYVVVFITHGLISFQPFEAPTKNNGASDNTFSAQVRAAPLGHHVFLLCSYEWKIWKNGQCVQQRSFICRVAVTVRVCVLFQQPPSVFQSNNPDSHYCWMTEGLRRVVVQW